MKRKLPEAISPTVITELRAALSDQDGKLQQYGAARDVPHFVLFQALQVVNALYDDSGRIRDGVRITLEDPKEFITVHVPGSERCNWPGYHWESEHGTPWTGEFSTAFDRIEKIYRQTGVEAPE